MPADTRSLGVAITGASGSLYAIRFLQRAVRYFAPIYLTVSRPALRVLEQETGLKMTLEEFDVARLLPEMAAEERERIVYSRPNSFDSPLASGSSGPDALVIVPCSTGTLGRIAAGTSDSLITRAAEVMLKERRKLILVSRETPLSLIQLRNMTTVTEAGAVVMPAAPGLYHRPQSVEEMVDFIVFRILDHLGVRDPDAQRWMASPEPAE